jgi:hypothetical protein
MQIFENSGRKFERETTYLFQEFTRKAWFKIPGGRRDPPLRTQLDKDRFRTINEISHILVFCYFGELHQTGTCVAERLILLDPIGNGHGGSSFFRCRNVFRQ